MERTLKIVLVFCLGLFWACSREKPVSILDAVPQDVTMILEAENSDALSEAVGSHVVTVGAFSDFAQTIQLMDSMFGKDAKVGEIIRSAQVALLLSPRGEQNACAVAYLLNKSLSFSNLYSIIESNKLIYEKRDYRKKSYLFVPDLPLCLAIEHNFLICSRDEDLLLKMLDQLENDVKLYDNPDFSKVYATLGHSVPVHLILDFDALETMAVKSASKKHQTALSCFLEHFKGLAALDVPSKQETLLLNGYSVATDSLSSLRPLKYQMPVHNSVVNVLPYQTKMMLHYGMSDYVSYWEEFVDKEQVARFEKRFKTDLEKQFVAFLSEVSYCVFGVTDKAVFVGRMNDPAAVIRFMDKMDVRAGVSESAVVQGYTLKNLNCKGFVPDVFGKCFQNIGGCCYSIVDQYLVVANDFQIIQDVISCYRSGRTLDLSDKFKSFQNNMLESDNVCLYLADAEIQSALQLAASKDLVYTSFCTRKMTESKEESNVQWRVDLDAPMIAKPYLVRDQNSKTYIVVFDVERMMYLIDNEGNIVWKKKISEPPMSEIELVDFNRDGQVQLLFNTANYLELMDLSGNDMEGYPKRLLCEASNGLSAFDYDKDRTYRVMVCGTDRFVYNYDLHGGETEGWNRHRTEELVTQPVQHLVADNKDFIIVTDISGTARILDRQGRIRIPLKADLHKSQGADFYENRTNHKGVVLTSDQDGKLLYVAQDGGLARTDFGMFSEKHYFLYEDFNGDQDPDFIYLDGNELQVFNRFKKLLYSHDFDAEITMKPVFYHLSRNKRLLGLVSEKAREIYLIGKNGNVTVSSGLIGTKGFAIGSLKGNNEINLLAGEGSSLFNYLIY